MMTLSLSRVSLGAGAIALALAIMPAIVTGQGGGYNVQYAKPYGSMSRQNSKRPQYTQSDRRFSDIHGYKYKNRLNRHNRLGKVGQRDYRIPR